MERLKLPLLCLACLLLNAVSAQVSTAEKVSKWYWKERFAAADANENALLEKSELAKFPSEFAYYLESRNFIIADENNDGELSYNEMQNKKNAEIAYRSTMENRQIRTLEGNFPELAKNPLTFLRSNPEMANTLFGNFTWMTKNAAVVSDLIKDKSWIDAATEAGNALNHNLCWMASNPNSAKYLYENRKNSFSTAELLGWRAEHIKFLRQNTVMDNFYTIDGYKDYVKVNKK